MNLFNIIKSDLCDRGIKIDNPNDLDELRTLAMKRKQWKNLYDMGDTD